MSGDWWVFRELLRTSKIGGAISFRCRHHRFNKPLNKFKYPNVRYRKQFEYYNHLSRESARQGGCRSRRKKQSGGLFLDGIEYLREQMPLKENPSGFFQQIIAAEVPCKTKEE